MQRKLCKSRYLVPIVMVWAALFYLVACNSGSSEGPSAGLSQTATLTSSHITANYAFIPNHGEASVSKVELLSGQAVARYYTAQRYGVEGNDVHPYFWRTSRIGMDSGGNAWVLNTAGDFFRNAPTWITTDTEFDQNAPSVEPPARTAVGSVARIQGNTDGLATTNADHAAPLAFGSDEAVQVFPVGEDGDIPRAIVIDGAGDIWIGFYVGGYFQKYTYDPNTGELDAVVGARVEGAFAPYDAVITSDGIIWFSSRDSTPNIGTTYGPIGAQKGVFSFDSANPGAGVATHETFHNPYALELDEANGILWVSSYNNELRAFYLNGAPRDLYTITGLQNGRAMALDGDGNLWITSSGNGLIMQFAGATGPPAKTYDTEFNLPVGLGLDAEGYLWAIMRDDNSTSTFGTPTDFNGGWIEKFDPAADAPIPQAAKVQVGVLPYAYGNFVVVEEEELCPFDDTAWAYGEGRATANNTITGSNNWGWTNAFATTDDFPVVMDLIAGAGQNILANGTVVGTVEVDYDAGCVTVTYAIDNTIPELEFEYTLLEAHLWVGTDMLPKDRRDRYISSPGQLGVSPEIAADGLSAEATVCGIEEDFWVAAHAVVGWMDECEEEEMEPIM
ncbi:hypothetical protein [Desulfurivibrio sp. C05AmB]|uniref:Vgb family protein n=1 Tax=Desulfurivibrio sp. C05AmB TaxID=3374371 RepID=UPI00376F0DBC